MIQAAALPILFFPRLAIVLLLIAFDVMHFGILLAGGLYFWTWIFLNVMLGVIVAQFDFRRTPMLLKVLAVSFVIGAPIIYSVAKLGWYDAGANTDTYIVALDDRGSEYRVSNNFFTFYSYGIGHMDYGTPDPDRAFLTGNPYGGVGTYAQFKAGRTCDVAALFKPAARRR